MPSSNQRSLPLIVLKLTVVMGITWILGFALGFYPTPYLEYPFVIINSCQGTFRGRGPSTQSLARVYSVYIVYRIVCTG